MLTELIAANQKELERRERPRRGCPRRGRRDRRRPAARSGGARRRRTGARRGRRGPRRDPALPVPAPDGIRQDDRGGRLRRGRANGRRAHPHPPQAARRPVPPRAPRARLRRSADRGDPRRPGGEAGRELITIQTYAWFARHVAEIDREAYQLVICDEAHTALGEKTSAAIRSLQEPGHRNLLWALWLIPRGAAS